jgi:PPOX class probable F420-dependent enzyme
MTGAVLPDPDTDFGRRVRARLRTERVIWFTTVGADATPQPNPVWFLWSDPATVLVYNRGDARRLHYIAGSARVALHLDGDGRGGDVVVLTGRAELAPQTQSAAENPDYLAKYGDAMTAVSGSAEQFAADYAVALTVHVERVRGF